MNVNTHARFIVLLVTVSATIVQVLHKNAPDLVSFQVSHTSAADLNILD